MPRSDDIVERLAKARLANEQAIRVTSHRTDFSVGVVHPETDKVQSIRVVTAASAKGAAEKYVARYSDKLSGADLIDVAPFREERGLSSSDVKTKGRYAATRGKSGWSVRPVSEKEK